MMCFLGYCKLAVKYNIEVQTEILSATTVEWYKAIRQRLPVLVQYLVEMLFYTENQSCQTTELRIL